MASSPTDALRVLVIEPYFGGSHRSFLKGLQRLPFQWEVWPLPARKWKWRMRLAAPYFARRLAEDGRRFDCVLCSPYLDVATFRGLAPRWVREVPLLVYFHENQFAYPVRVEDERDWHFSLTNLTTALAADRLAFNSQYNLESLLEGAEEVLRYSHDLSLKHATVAVRERSRVIPPGMDFNDIDASAGTRAPDAPPVILWNHRWEHDKGPETFFHALFRLANEKVPFRLIVLGESYEHQPPVFGEAYSRLRDRILQWGYADSRRDYVRLLHGSDIVVSTAKHEFFGISVMEAVRAGCRPLLPRRLSYPELYPGRYLYEHGDLADRLRELLRHWGGPCEGRLPAEEARALTEPCSWETLAPEYRSWLMGD